MEKIFTENVFIGYETYRYVEHSGFKGLCVQTVEHQIYCSCTAHFDIALQVLLVQCYMDAGMDDDDERLNWTIKGERTLETFSGPPSQAIRRVIEISDSYQAKVKGLIPPPDTRTDEEILSAARSRSAVEV